MNINSNTFKTAFLFLLAIANGATVIDAQDSKKEKDSLKAVAVTNMVAAKDYVFQAEWASPMKGGRKYLSGGYTLMVSKDTLTSDLPYYGRAYQSDYGATDGGIKFTSTNFEYTVTDHKKGEWDISIKPKDSGKVREMNLTIFDNGSASLQVNSSDRQPISFDGYIEERKPKK